jgi:hypothetical protein
MTSLAPIGQKPEEPKPDSARDLNCTWYFDGMVRCAGFGNQITHLYHTGELDSCRDAYESFASCLAIKYKSIGDMEEATRRLKASQLKESPTVGVVWDERERPSLFYEDDHDSTHAFGGSSEGD